MKYLPNDILKRPETPPWAQSAAVDASGDAHFFNCAVAPDPAVGCFDAKYSDNPIVFKMKRIGGGYTATEWQLSAIHKNI